MIIRAPRIFPGLFSCFLLLAMYSHAQIHSHTTTKVFSERALQDARERIKVLNQFSNTKIILSFSLFHLRNERLKVQTDLSILGVHTLSELTPDLLMQESESSAIEFNSFKAQSDQKAQTLLNSQPGAANILLINLTLGIQLIGYSANISSYHHFTVLSGANVAASKKQYWEQTLAKLPPFDFADATDKNNDAILEEMVSQFYLQTVPFDISYEDNGAKNLDDNSANECKHFPSFATRPVSGIPWKCIPADGTFTPIKVSITSIHGSGSVLFRLSNALDFKLRSPTPDASSLLWIACSVKNKETAIMPSVNGVDITFQQLNVVAYEKIIKEVAVVIIEEENDDVQLVPYETKGLSAITPVVVSGPNRFLDSRPGFGDDHVRYDTARKDSTIVAGPDGICETQADNTNTTPLDIDLNELERQLNLFYNPIMVEWKVAKTKYVKKINYDLNRNYLLDIQLYIQTPTGWKPLPAPEEDMINTHGPVGGFTHHLYFVDRIPGTGVLGRTTGNQKSALIFTRAIEDHVEKPHLQDALITTCAHELGHTGYDLDHPSTTDDGRNLMGTGNVSLHDTHLRKFQWDIIHGIAKP